MTLVLAAGIAERGFEVDLSVETGETVAVLGPNGAGKSTLLGIVAGLLRPDAGRANLDDRVLFDLSDGRGRWIPPHERGVSMLTQDADLFPHLSVLENVAFGARSKGMTRAAAHEHARHWLSEVDALEFAARRPAELSGGQAQRVAIARALAADPELLLLDEPLAALDVHVAPAIRRTLLRVLSERTAVIVTHDILDALTLSDRVIVLGEGRVIESGPTRSTLERPRTAFTAGLAALNLLLGIRTPTGMTTDAGADIVTALATDAAVGERVVAIIRPSAVTVSVGAPRAAENMIDGEILDLEPRGDVIRVRSDAIAADLSPGAVADAQLSTGSRVTFGFPAGAVAIHRAEQAADSAALGGVDQP
jgi:molybdate transport system ATP-binding protein